jgi:hypothetical protein
MKKIWTFILLIGLTWGLVGCGGRLEASQPLEREQSPKSVQVGRLSEVSPPPVIEKLKQTLDQYQPQVSILSPKADRVLQETTVKVQLQVKDLPIFKDSTLGLGPHLHLFLDNEPYRAIYDTNSPLVLENLSPGTHTLRVFASRPWHESFKNDGAYAQTTFHVFTKTEDNKPDPSLPLLTYSRPTGNYGAEPIMLDFYLTNAPLHFVAQENSEDAIADWRIRVTINGQKFLLDTWQPIYLKGFETGNNWVQLEFIDENGNFVDNAFNNTVRLITYSPNGQDTLSKLVRGELSVADVRGIVDPNYKVPPATVEIPPPTVEEEISQPSEVIPPPVEESSKVEPEKAIEETTSLDKQKS